MRCAVSTVPSDRDGDVVDRMSDKSPIQQNSLDADLLPHDIHSPSSESSAHGHAITRRGRSQRDLCPISVLDFLDIEWPAAKGTENFFETDDDVCSWLPQASLAPDEVTEVRPQA